MGEKGLIEILEASIQELYALRQESGFSALYRGYLEVLIAYLSGDLEDLQRAIDQNFNKSVSKSGMESDLVRELAQLRFQIRSRRIDLDGLRALGLRDWKHIANIWRAEAHFLLARAHEVLRQQHEAMEHYLRAYELFNQNSCPRKAVRCLQNHFAARSRIQTDLNFITDYLQIVRAARKTGEYGIAGVAAMNVSRELQAVGALRAALKYANRALMLMSKDLGSQHFYLALVHRCHLYLELGRTSDARLDLETAKSSKHQEIISAVHFLESRHGATDPNISNDLTEGWRARILLKGNAILGESEDRLIELLCSGPKSKSALLSILWGESLTYEVLNLRFKSLLTRIRKKRDGLIVFNGRDYSLSERSFTHVAS